MEWDNWQFPWSEGWPEIDRAGMFEVNRRMVATYGIALEKMMENAGGALATVAWWRWLADISVPPAHYAGMACRMRPPSFRGEDILRTA
jgi:hypothetical protein